MKNKELEKRWMKYLINFITAVSIYILGYFEKKEVKKDEKIEHRSRT